MTKRWMLDEDDYPSEDYELPRYAYVQEEDEEDIPLNERPDVWTLNQEDPDFHTMDSEHEIFIGKRVEIDDESKTTEKVETMRMEPLNFTEFSKENETEATTIMSEQDQDLVSSTNLWPRLMVG